MVRTRSDEKRREIIRVAAETFQELGYERTSMLTIAERMRGSKQTLYNYFASKEDLLRAVLAFDVGEVADQALGNLRAEKSLRKGLARLGEVYLARQLAPLAISNIRNVATQPAESGIGEDFYQNILCAAWKRVADAFNELMVRRHAGARGPVARGHALQGPGAAGLPRAAASQRGEGDQPQSDRDRRETGRRCLPQNLRR